MENNVKAFIETHPTFTMGEFTDMVRIETPGIGHSTIFQMLKDLCESGKITRIRNIAGFI